MRHMPPVEHEAYREILRDGLRPEAFQALEPFMTEAMRAGLAAMAFAPAAVRNWNWPDIADAFAQGTLGAYIDAHSSAAVLNNPEKSQVIGKIGFARWPKGPNGKRVTSIWNWGFPINAALSDKAKRATWLFITWAASAETQARTSWKFAGPAKRSGVNRASLWKAPDFVALMRASGDNFVEAAQQSLEQDTDVEWRPRVPQWPALGDTMGSPSSPRWSARRRRRKRLTRRRPASIRSCGAEPSEGRLAIG